MLLVNAQQFKLQADSLRPQISGLSGPATDKRPAALGHVQQSSQSTSRSNDAGAACGAAGSTRQIALVEQ
jgi:hypothetical protein